jgi:hypothetical protein
LESRNEHPTSNIEQPMFHAPAGAVLWMLVVRCSMLDVSSFILEEAVATLIQKPYEC